jgi:DNA-binding response OmpR family regulator
MEPGRSGKPRACTEVYKRRILVIDDAKSIRELLRLHLSNEGYEVLLAEDAVAGGKLLVEHAPDLVIVDVNMPFMSGIEFVEAVRADPECADLPIIFLTSRDDIGPVAAKLRAAALLRKPVGAEHLLEIVGLHSFRR